MTKCLSSSIEKSLSLLPPPIWDTTLAGMANGGGARRGKQRDNHVTKRAVNNADGQCCELRWYRTHKRHGFMFAATRRSQPHSADRSRFVDDDDDVASAAATDDPGPTALSRRTLFFSRNWCFLRRRLLRPRSRPFCRNKVTLLPVTLRSGTLNARVLLQYPLPWPLFYCRRNLGYYGDVMLIDARGRHGDKKKLMWIPHRELIN